MENKFEAEDIELFEIDESFDSFTPITKKTIDSKERFSPNDISRSLLMYINESSLAVAHCESLLNELQIEKLRALEVSTNLIEAEYRHAESQINSVISQLSIIRSGLKEHYFTMQEGPALYKGQESTIAKHAQQIKDLLEESDEVTIEIEIYDRNHISKLKEENWQLKNQIEKLYSYLERNKENKPTKAKRKSPKDNRQVNLKIKSPQRLESPELELLQSGSSATKRLDDYINQYSLSMSDLDYDVLQTSQKRAVLPIFSETQIKAPLEPKMQNRYDAIIDMFREIDPDLSRSFKFEDILNFVKRKLKENSQIAINIELCYEIFAGLNSNLKSLVTVAEFAHFYVLIEKLTPN